VLDIKARSGFGRVIGPLVRWLSRSRITPTWVTIAGLLVTIGGAVIIGAGHPFTGALVCGVGSVLDTIDGPLARATDRVSRRGAFLDTMSDRLGEAAIWTGIGWWVAGDRTLVVLVVIGLAMSLLVPYVRSKAEGAGVEGRGGLMGRAERMLLLLAGVGVHGFDLVATLEPTLWAMAVLTTLTVAQRTWRTWSEL